MQRKRIERGVLVAVLSSGLGTPAVVRGAPSGVVAPAPETAEPADPGDAPSPGTGESTPTTEAAPRAAAPPAATPPVASPQTIEAALAVGDLRTAIGLARRLREAEPTAANWHREAEIAEQLGDLEAAASAYEGELATLPPDAGPAREAAQADLSRVRSQARGVVRGEPTSTHRDELDRRWIPSAAPPTKAGSPMARMEAPSIAVEVQQGRVVDKWYFWLTIGVIVASGATVAALAVRASNEERSDALDPRRGRAPEVRGLGLRF